MNGAEPASDADLIITRSDRSFNKGMNLFKLMYIVHLKPASRIIKL